MEPRKSRVDKEAIPIGSFILGALKAKTYAWIPHSREAAGGTGAFLAVGSLQSI
jgi:hypothetical protein